MTQPEKNPPARPGLTGSISSKDIDFGPLFRTPKEEMPSIENNPAPKKDLRLDAEKWILSNPKAVELLLGWARELVAKERRFGIGMLWEKLRFESLLSMAKGEEYRLNNNYRAYVARHMISKAPEIEKWMEFREVHW